MYFLSICNQLLMVVLSKKNILVNIRGNCEYLYGRIRADIHCFYFIYTFGHQKPHIRSINDGIQVQRNDFSPLGSRRCPSVSRRVFPGRGEGNHSLHAAALGRCRSRQTRAMESVSITAVS